MAYVESYKIKKYASASTSTAGEWPPHVSGDLLIAVFSMKNSTEDFGTPTGMTSVGTGYGGNNIALKAFWISATSSSMTDPTSTGHTSTTYRACATFVIKDAPSTSPIDTPYGTGINSSPFEVVPSQTGSTTSADVLMLHVCAVDQWRHLDLEPGPMGIFNEYTSDGQYSMAAAWTFQETAGSIESFDWWLTRNVDIGASMSIPIKSDTGVNPPRGVVSSPCATIMYPGTDSTSGYLSYTIANPTTDVSSITPSTGDTSSITTAYSAPVNVGASGQSVYKYLDSISYSTANQMGVARIDFDDGPYDATGKKVCFHTVATQGLYTTRTASLEEHGIIVGLVSDTTTKEYAMWDSAGNDTRAHEINCVVIDANSTKMDEVNTFDYSDIRGAFVGLHNIAGSANVMSYDTIAIMNTVVLRGGDSTFPASWSTARDVVRSCGLLTIEKLGDAYQTKHDIQIGNGTNAVYFETNGEVLLTAPDGTYASQNMEFQAEKVTITAYGVSGDTIKFNDPVIAEKLGDFTIHASSTSAATWDFNGATFTNWNFSAAADIGAISGATFNSCKTFSNDSLDMSGGCTIINGQDTNAITINGSTQAALQALLDQYANCTLESNTTAVRVEYTGTGDISLSFDAVTFTSNTTDIHYNSTNSSALTASMLNGSNASTSAISGSATSVTISNSVAVKVTVKDAADTSAIQNARVYLVADTGGPLSAGTEILNGLSDASGIVQDTSFNYSSDQPVTGKVRKGTTTPLYETAPLSGTITTNGLDITAFMTSDE